MRPFYFRLCLLVAFTSSLSVFAGLPGRRIAHDDPPYRIPNQFARKLIGPKLKRGDQLHLKAVLRNKVIMVNYRYSGDTGKLQAAGSYTFTRLQILSVFDSAALEALSGRA